jgi:serine/threonine protein kinase
LIWSHKCSSLNLD